MSDDDGMDATLAACVGVQDMLLEWVTQRRGKAVAADEGEAEEDDDDDGETDDDAETGEEESAHASQSEDDDDDEDIRMDDDATGTGTEEDTEDEAEDVVDVDPMEAARWRWRTHDDDVLAMLRVADDDSDTVRHIYLAASIQAFVRRFQAAEATSAAGGGDAVFAAVSHELDRVSDVCRRIYHSLRDGRHLLWDQWMSTIDAAMHRRFRARGARSRTL